MYVSFNEQPKVALTRKPNFVERLADRLVALGIARTRSGGVTLIATAAVLIFIGSAYLLLQHLNSAQSAVPGVDFIAPIDPSF